MAVVWQHARYFPDAFAILMFYPGKLALQSPSQLSPESRLNMAMRGWPRLSLSDPINQGLVGYWSMDGGTISGTTLADLSGNGNNGTLVNGPTLVPGLVGQALSFNGTNQKISFSSTGLGTAHGIIFDMDYQNAADAVVIGGVDNVGVSTDYAPYIDGPGASNSIYYKAGNTGAIFVSVVHGGFTSGTVYRMAIVRSGTSVSFFKNGIQIGTTQTLGNNNPSTLGALGDLSSGSSIPFKGRLSKVRLFALAPSLDETRRLYSDQSGNLGLVAPTRRLIGATAATFKPAWAIGANKVYDGVTV